MKKSNLSKLMLLPITLLGYLPFASAAVNGPSGSLSGLFNFIGTVIGYLSSFFDFGWLAGHEVGFMKFLLWILIFAIFFAGGNIVFARIYGNAEGPARRNASILAIILATTTILLTPGDLIATIFAAYATVIIFLMILVPIALIIYIIYFGPMTAGLQGPILHIVRIFGLLLCWIILSVISQNADRLTGTTTFAAPLFITLAGLSGNFKAKEHNNRRMR